MQIILILLLVMVISLVGMYFFFNAYTAFCYKFIVLRKVEDLDRLMEFGVVPSNWRFRWLEKIGWMSTLLRCYYRWRLWRVIGFARRLTDLDQREACLDFLRRLQIEWRNAKSIDELTNLAKL